MGGPVRDAYVGAVQGGAQLADSVAEVAIGSLSPAAYSVRSPTYASTLRKCLAGRASSQSRTSGSISIAKSSSTPIYVVGDIPKLARVSSGGYRVGPQWWAVSW